MLSGGIYEGQVAIVVGGGSGLGFAIARELAGLGATVVVAGRHPEALIETAGLIRAAGSRAHAHTADVREADQVDALIAAAVGEFGRVDVLVNNAAGDVVKGAESLSADEWQSVVSLVVDGGYLCAQAAARQMIEQGDGGAILNVLATYAWTGGAGSAYSAAVKAGLLAMMRALAAEWAPHGIRVNAITPGPTDTDGARAALWPTEEDRERAAASIPAGRLGKPEEMAWWATALCSPYADFITGQNLTIDGGYGLEREAYIPALATHAQ